jgi:hypothetical protein
MPVPQRQHQAILLRHCDLQLGLLLRSGLLLGRDRRKMLLRLIGGMRVL